MIDGFARGLLVFAAALVAPVVAVAQAEKEEVTPPLYPMPYSPSDVPLRFREPPVARMPSTFLPIGAPEEIARHAPATATPTGDRHAVGAGIDVGVASQRGGDAARLIGDVSAELGGAIELRLRVPLVVADAGLIEHTTNAATEASTARLGNATLGATHHIAYRDFVVGYGGDVVLPLATAPPPGVDRPATLERQLATRAYQLASSVDGMRSMWLFQPNVWGAVVHGAIERSNARWLLTGRLDAGLLLPVRDEPNAAVVLQVEAMVGRTVGPLTFGLRTGVAMLAATEIVAPNFTPFIAATDGTGRIWSLRLAWIPTSVAWDVPAWGLSVGYGNVVP
jgi:hypothetical protein